MNIFGRKKIGPFHLMPGDSVQLTWRDQNGKVLLIDKTVPTSHCMVVDEGVLFTTTFEGRRALGGMVLEQEK